MKFATSIIGLGLFLTVLSDAVWSQEKLIRVEYLPDVAQSIYPEQALQTVRAQLQDLAEIEGELNIQPYVMVEKIKIPGNQLRAQIMEKGVSVTKVYNDTQTIQLKSTYKIPQCGDVGNKWRLQIAAISDNNVVASEEFYHLIKGLTDNCGLVNGDLNNRRFCKTDGEIFGQQVTTGGNSTSRLFIILDNESELSSKNKHALGQECRQNMETTLREKINSCLGVVKQKMNEDVSLNIQNRVGSVTYIVPPVDVVKKYFKIENDKLQFQSCDSLEKTPAIH